MPRSNITSRQKETISFLYKCNTFQQAARAARVGANTVQKWMTQPNFVEALACMDDDLRTFSSRRLLGLASKAIDTLEELMDDSDLNDRVRFISAQFVLSFIYSSMEDLGQSNPGLNPVRPDNEIPLSSIINRDKS